jgi:4-hydroxy-tetrahydrodipicolinate synthase
MNARTLTLRGIIPSMVTPFDNNGKLERDWLKRETEFLTQADVDGLCVGGVISETAGARPEEVHLICKTVISSTNKPVIAGILPDCTSEALELASACASAGAQALSVSPPHYLFCPDREGLIELFAAVREQVDVPVLLANSIPTAQVDLTSMTALTDRGLIDGIHQGAGNAHLLADILNLKSRLAVYTGVEDLLYMAFLLGAEGAISALAAVFPKDCVALYRAHQNRDFDRARQIHEKLNRWWRILDHPVEFLSRVKSALALQQRPVGVPRSPYNVLSSYGQSSVQEALERQIKLP